MLQELPPTTVPATTAVIALDARALTLGRLFTFAMMPPYELDTTMPKVLSRTLASAYITQITFACSP